MHEFCELCLRATTADACDHEQGNLFFGIKLLGAADRCEHCGSVVKTLWGCLLIPLIPMESYRAVSLAAAPCATRATRRIHWPQVIRTYLVAIPLVMLLGWLAMETGVLASRGSQSHLGP